MIEFRELLRNLDMNYLSRDSSKVTETWDDLTLEFSINNPADLTSFLDILLQLENASPNCILRLSIVIHIPKLVHIDLEFLYSLDSFEVKQREIPVSKVSPELDEIVQAAKEFKRGETYKFELLTKFLNSISQNISKHEVSIDSSLVLDKERFSEVPGLLAEPLEDNLKIIIFCSAPSFKKYLQSFNPEDYLNHFFSESNGSLILVGNLGGWVVGSYHAWIDLFSDESLTLGIRRFNEKRERNFMEKVQFHSRLTRYDSNVRVAFPGLFRIIEGDVNLKQELEGFLHPLKQHAIICSFCSKVRHIEGNLWELIVEGYRTIEARVVYEISQLIIDKVPFDVDSNSLLTDYEWAFSEGFTDKVLVYRRSLTFYISQLSKLADKDNLKQIRISAESAYDKFLDEATRKAVESQQKFLDFFQGAMHKDSEFIMKLDGEVNNAVVGSIAVALTTLLGWVFKASDPAALQIIALWAPLIFALYLSVSFIRVLLLRDIHDNFSKRVKLQLDSHERLIGEIIVEPYRKDMTKERFMNRSIKHLVILGLLMAASWTIFLVTWFRSYV